MRPGKQIGHAATGPGKITDRQMWWQATSTLHREKSKRANQAKVISPQRSLPAMSEPATIPPPRRCYELDIKIGGDSWADVLRHLDELSRHIPEHGQECNSVSGGYSGNHWVTCYHDLDMTHDKYFELLDAHLASTRRTSHE